MSDKLEELEDAVEDNKAKRIKYLARSSLGLPKRLRTHSQRYARQLEGLEKMISGTKQKLSDSQERRIDTKIKKITKTKKRLNAEIELHKLREQVESLKRKKRRQEHGR